MKDFRNSVLNFSWRTDREDLAGVARPAFAVDPSTPAVTVAKMAALNDVSIVAIQGHDRKTLGFFLPDYLAELLPDHDLPRRGGVSFAPDAGLAEMIEAIDAAGLEFHSELVNVAPNLRRCPTGHLVMGAYCQTHKVQTQPWQ
jgi:hypothetical protein